MARRVVVVGGGPVGALTATHLAQQGWDVHVLEKRGELPGRPPREDPRAYCLVLSPRGIEALLASGMDLSALTAASNGKLSMRMYGPNGKGGMVQEAIIDPLKPGRLMLYRDELNRHVLTEMQRLQPAVSLHLNANVTRIDFDKQEVAFAQGSGPTEVLQYDLLVGADGAGSAVRKAMAEIMPPGFSRQRTADARYAMVALPPVEPGTKTHSTFERHDFKAGGILWSDRGDGDRRLAVNLTARWVDRLREDPTVLDKYIDNHKHVPNLPDDVRERAKELLHSQPEFRVLARWTWLDRLTGPKVVLMGDAAHSMSPTLGQACNCGLEDAKIFAGILEASKGNVDAALKQYNAERLPDVLALVNLNQMWSARIGMRTEGLSFSESVWMTCHTIMISLTMGLRYVPHKLAPSIFPQPALMQCILGSRPYHHIFTEMYSVLAVLAGLSLIPIVRILTRL